MFEVERNSSIINIKLCLISHMTSKRQLCDSLTLNAFKKHCSVPWENLTVLKLWNQSHSMPRLRQWCGRVHLLHAAATLFRYFSCSMRWLVCFVHRRLRHPNRSLTTCCIVFCNVQYISSCFTGWRVCLLPCRHRRCGGCERSHTASAGASASIRCTSSPFVCVIAASHAERLAAVSTASPSNAQHGQLAQPAQQSQVVIFGQSSISSAPTPGGGRVHDAGRKSWVSSTACVKAYCGGCCSCSNFIGTVVQLEMFVLPRNQRKGKVTLSKSFQHQVQFWLKSFWGVNIAIWEEECSQSVLPIEVKHTSMPYTKLQLTLHFALAALDCWVASPARLRFPVFFYSMSTAYNCGHF